MPPEIAVFAALSPVIHYTPEPVFLLFSWCAVPADLLWVLILIQAELQAKHNSAVSLRAMFFAV
ncbi:hypothetical protein TALK_21210 [Thalassospira alkalitolerans]|uniref:Uncharacterized protein n=1 Tax=Thalassospira alkalitolerans TaxID=1293890 RepID=A0A1Y2L655_9PROT|nr:hypothetical protein TALK_21210 [Thalassospira alkalitolerans]